MKKKILKVPENIFIGSKERLLFPMHELIYGATLFVEPQEYEDYNSVYGDRFNMIKLKKNEGGFPFLLNSMLNYAKQKGFEHYFFSDDDIFGFKCRNPKSNLLYELKQMEKLIKKNNYSQLMMSFSGHNWFYKKVLKEKIGAWGFILNNTEDLLSVGGYDKDIKIYTDWDISAKLIRADFKTACYYNVMFEHKMKAFKGGAEKLYKQQTLDEVAEILKKKYGEKCLRKKEIHNQIEIRFNWKKL